VVPIPLAHLSDPVDIDDTELNHPEGMPKKKKPDLLIKHLENVSWRVLEDYQSVIKKMIRGRSGVYALYRRGKLYYVGLASNLMGRLKTHLRDRHNGRWDRFSVYLTGRDEHMKELESLLLRIVNPTGNKQTGKFAGAEDLRLRLNRLMKDADADRRALLLGGHVARRRVRSKTSKKKGTRVLSGVVARRFVLKGRLKGVGYRATLRKDGSISYDGKVYDSPSAAGRAVSGRSCNGWQFWHYRNDNGEWVPLKKLRK